MFKPGDVVTVKKESGSAYVGDRGVVIPPYGKADPWPVRIRWDRTRLDYGYPLHDVLMLEEQLSLFV